jgi:hypothetical protein
MRIFILSMSGNLYIYHKYKLPFWFLILSSCLFGGYTAKATGWQRQPLQTELIILRNTETAGRNASYKQIVTDSCKINKCYDKSRQLLSGNFIPLTQLYSVCWQSHCIKATAQCQYGFSPSPSCHHSWQNIIYHLPVIVRSRS